jgi:nitrogen fixation NifU-like protein
VSEVAAYDFDRLLMELQRLIDEQARATYSPQVIHESRYPSNVGRMGDCDASAAVLGWCGDTMEVYLRVQDGKIAQATFLTDGCGPTVASGSMLIKIVSGLPLDEALQITADDLLAALGGLPDENAHCAQLAVNTLHQALSDYQSTSTSTKTSAEAPEKAGHSIGPGRE